MRAMQQWCMCGIYMGSWDVCATVHAAARLEVKPSPNKGARFFVVWCVRRESTTRHGRLHMPWASYEMGARGVAQLEAQHTHQKHGRRPTNQNKKKVVVGRE